MSNEGRGHVVEDDDVEDERIEEELDEMLEDEYANVEDEEEDEEGEEGEGGEEGELSVDDIQQQIKNMQLLEISREGNPALLRMILQDGADPNDVDEETTPALFEGEEKKKKKKKLPFLSVLTHLPTSSTPHPPPLLSDRS